MSAILTAQVDPVLAGSMTDQAAASSEHGETGLVGWILDLMEDLGEVGVGIAVLAETFVPPIPSEAVLPVAGYLAFEGRMNPYLAVAAATVGSLIGAWVWWFVGRALGRDRTRALVARVPLLDGDDFDKAQSFFDRWGPAAVLLGRCVPLVRSFISIPAGIARMRLLPFTIYTVIGSLIWNALWVGLGYALGPAMEPILTRWSDVLSDVMIGAGIATAAAFVVIRLRRRSRGATASP